MNSPASDDDRREMMITLHLFLDLEPLFMGFGPWNQDDGPRAQDDGG